MDLVIALLGWIGAGLMLVSYALVSTRRLRADGLTYQLMNVVGAVLLGLNTAYNGAWPSTLLNVFWLVIGLLALGRLVARGERSSLREHQSTI